MSQPEQVAFSNCIDLLAESLGGRALSCSDDFFAGMENLVKPGRGVFIPGKFTENGKWMDGWESRRKRTEGNDWCVLALGVAGELRAFDIDTNHFLGNHPPFAAVWGCWAPEAGRGEPSESVVWHRILEPSALRPGSQNMFAVNSQPVTHLRLEIFPDGGVARLRAYGIPRPLWRWGDDDARLSGRLEEGECDLAALRNGGKALVCSDMFFGPMHNLIAPGRARVMGEGWETKRSRRVGHDWIILELGEEGTPSMVVMDTNHFKGNFPESASLCGIRAPDASVLELAQGDPGWKPLVPRTKLEVHAEHFFRKEVGDAGPCTHVKLRIWPDGGVSRLRVYGRRTASSGQTYH